MSRKVLIVVHGMGEQTRNQTLLGLVRPMLALMRKRGDPAKLRPLDESSLVEIPPFVVKYALLSDSSTRR